MIEKGRHINIIMKDRNCPICNMGLIENEEHNLLLLLLLLLLLYNIYKAPI